MHIMMTNSDLYRTIKLPEGVIRQLYEYEKTYCRITCRNNKNAFFESHIAKGHLVLKRVYEIS